MSDLIHETIIAIGAREACEIAAIASNIFHKDPLNREVQIDIVADFGTGERHHFLTISWQRRPLSKPNYVILGGNDEYTGLQYFDNLSLLIAWVGQQWAEFTKPVSY